jgi:hypothetical protein
MLFFAHHVNRPKNRRPAARSAPAQSRHSDGVLLTSGLLHDNRTAGGSLDAFRDALGRGALLLNCGGNRCGDPADTLDRLPNRLDRITD